MIGKNLRFERMILAFVYLFFICSCDDPTPPVTDSDVESESDADIETTFDADEDDPGDADEQEDADEQTDAESDIDVIRFGHESYVPDDYQPDSAARLIIMGDSISAGVGAHPRSNFYGSLLHQNNDDLYPVEQGNDLVSIYGEEMEFINVAFGGAITNNLASQAEDLAGHIDYPAVGHTIVVITIGGNNYQILLLVGQDFAGKFLGLAIEDIRDLYNWYQDKKRFPDGVSFYVAVVYDPSDGVGQIDECFGGMELVGAVEGLESWYRAYMDLGREEGFSVVDMLGFFHGHGFHYDDPANPYYDSADPTHWFDDCIHPNNLGHHELRRLFLETIDDAYVAD